MRLLQVNISEFRSIAEHWTAPAKLEGLCCRHELLYQDSLAFVVIFLEFFRGCITARRVKTFLIIPGYPLQRSESYIRHSFPWPFRIDELLLVQTVKRFRSSVIVRISLASHRA